MGLGLEYSVLPGLTVSGVDMQMNAIMGDVRVFPLETGFFIGVGVGRQHPLRDQPDGAPRASSAARLPTGRSTIDTYILNPSIGYLATWSWGLTLGIDAGLQIPLSASFNTTQNTIPSGIAISPDPTGTANLFGKSVLPTVDLLRVGLLLWTGASANPARRAIATSERGDCESGPGAFSVLRSGPCSACSCFRVVGGGCLAQLAPRSRSLV